MNQMLESFHHTNYNAQSWKMHAKMVGSRTFKSEHQKFFRVRRKKSLFYRQLSHVADILAILWAIRKWVILVPNTIILILDEKNEWKWIYVYIHIYKNVFTENECYINTCTISSDHCWRSAYTEQWLKVVWIYPVLLGQ